MVRDNNPKDKKKVKGDCSQEPNAGRLPVAVHPHGRDDHRDA